MSDNPRAVIGGNLPPLKTGDDLTSYLEETYAEDVQRTQALMAKGVEFLTIGSDAEDEAATEFMVKVRARYKESEASRVKEKTPYDDSAGRVHAFFKTKVLDLLGLAPTDKKSFDPVTRTDLGLGPRINMAQTIFKTAKAEAERRRREEEARIAAEEERKRREAAEAAERAAREAERSAARKRSEESRAVAEAEAAKRRAEADAAREAENKAAEERAAAQAAASAPMADLSRARGDRGGVSSLKTFTDFRDIDREKIDLEMLRPYLPDKALEQAVRGWIDANKAATATAIKTGNQPIKGVVIFEAHRSSGRA
jgi:flagellar biosynthesis GTPase FlhF